MAANGVSLDVDVIVSILPQVIERFPKAVDSIFEKTAYAIQAYAKQHHPWQNQTGQTEESIEAEKLGMTDWVVHFGGASIYLEYGTVNMPPYPFVHPAVDAVYPKMIDMLSSLEGLLK